MILETEKSLFYYYVQLWFKYSFKEDALKNKTHTISAHTNNKDTKYSTVHSIFLN